LVKKLFELNIPIVYNMIGEPGGLKTSGRRGAQAHFAPKFPLAFVAMQLQSAYKPRMYKQNKTVLKVSFRTKVFGSLTRRPNRSIHYLFGQGILTNKWASAKCQKRI